MARSFYVRDACWEGTVFPGSDNGLPQAVTQGSSMKLFILVALCPMLLAQQGPSRIAVVNGEAVLVGTQEGKKAFEQIKGLCAGICRAALHAVFLNATNSVLVATIR